MAEMTHIKCTKEGDLLRLQLNRPAVLNALAPETLVELDRILGEIHGDTTIRVVEISGAGRGFSAGFDVGAFGKMLQGGFPPREEVEKAAEIGERVIDGLRSLPQVTVASVHGFVIGGGFLLMSACDFRVVSQNTIFSIPEIDIGFPLSWGGVPLVAQVLGTEMARDVIMSARKFTAEEVYSRGAIHRLVEESERLVTVSELIDQLMLKPALPLRQTKEQFLGINGKKIPSDAQLFADAALDPGFFPAVMNYMAKMKKS